MLAADAPDGDDSPPLLAARRPRGVAKPGGERHMFIGLRRRQSSHLRAQRNGAVCERQRPMAAQRAFRRRTVAKARGSGPAAVALLVPAEARPADDERVGAVPRVVGIVDIRWPGIVPNAQLQRADVPDLDADHEVVRRPQVSGRELRCLEFACSLRRGGVSRPPDGVITCANGSWPWCLRTPAGAPARTPAGGSTGPSAR